MHTSTLAARLTSNKRVVTAAHLSNGGWGFLIAWGLATVLTDLFMPDGSLDLGWFWLASMIGAPIGLLGFFLAGKRSLDERTWEVLVISAVSAMTIGTVLLELSTHLASEQRHILCVTAGLLSSLGTAILTVAWGTQYSRLDMAAIERVSALSLFVGFVSYALVIFLPRTAGVVLTALLPLLSAACLWLSSAVEPPLPSAHHAPSSAPRIDTTGFVRLGIGITATTLVVSLFWNFASQGIIPIESRAFSVAVLSGSVIALAFMIYLFRYTRSLNLGTLYRWTLPLIAVGFSCLLFRTPVLLMASALIVFAAQALLNLITFVHFAELARSTGVSPLRIFGLGRFFVEFGFLLGILLGPFAQQLIPVVGGSYQDVLFIALSVLVMAVMYSIATQDRLAFTLNSSEEGVDNTSKPLPDSSDEAPLDDAEFDAFQRACHEVANQFNLTKRESEILPYLAQGYTLPYIRNELYISQSTIDTHVRHIYRKMGLHSKGELITYVRDLSSSLR